MSNDIQTQFNHLKTFLKDFEHALLAKLDELEQQLADARLSNEHWASTRRALNAKLAETEERFADARLEIVAGRAVREELEEKAETWQATAETGAYIRDSAECQNLRAELAAALEVIKTVASPDYFGAPHKLAREFLAKETTP